MYYLVGTNRYNKKLYFSVHYGWVSRRDKATLFSTKPDAYARLTPNETDKFHGIQIRKAT